jgi:glycosyltransferase involved in cell wall biosynthesis
LEEKIQLGAGPNISFLGAQPREAIGRLLRRSRALIFPSLCLEGLPNTILEAYSAATPVIASDNENLAQIVSSGYNGVLFKMGNPQSLQEALKGFEKADEASLGRNARTTYEAKYTHTQNLMELRRIYEKVISEK